MDKEKQIKLQSALIEVGKEVEAIKETPGYVDMRTELALLGASEDEGDMKSMRKHGRKLAAMVIKFMTDKL